MWRRWGPSDARVVSSSWRYDLSSCPLALHASAHHGAATPSPQVRPSSCPGCPALWLAYLRLEASAAGRMHAASRVLLRALQQCPGAKRLWTAALCRPLVAILPAEQLRDTVQLMADKEIRLRHDPPETLEPGSPRPLAESAESVLESAGGSPRPLAEPEMSAEPFVKAQGRQPPTSSITGPPHGKATTSASGLGGSSSSSSSSRSGIGGGGESSEASGSSSSASASEDDVDDPQ